MKQAPFGGAQYTLRSATADRFRMLVEAVYDYGIFMADPEGRVFSWNPGAEKWNGLTSSEIIGQHISVLYTAEDVAAGKPEHGLSEALENGRFEEEGLRLRKNAQPFMAAVIITPVRDEAGTHLGFAIVTRDLTAQREASDALRLRDRALASLTQGVCITDRSSC